MKKFLYIIFLIAISSNLFSQKSFPETPKISGNGFLTYQMEFDENNENIDNRFKIKRAYLTTSGKLTEDLSYKLTIDCFDSEKGATNRVRAFYGSYHIWDLAQLFTDNAIEFGIISTPLMDYLQTTNRYRMYEKMVMERYDLTYTADLGISLSGNIGGEVSKDYQNKVSSRYNGKFGTYQIGVYNGGGYTKIDTEKNMAYHGRVTLRPFGDMLPNLELTSYGFITKMFDATKEKNEGENAFGSEFALSYKESRFNLLAEFITGKGDPTLKLIEDDGSAKKWTGFSVFGEFKFFKNWAILARYENLDVSVKYPDYNITSISGGVSYEIFKDNIILLIYDRQEKEKYSIKTPKHIVEATYQLKF